MVIEACRAVLTEFRSCANSWPPHVASGAPHWLVVVISVSLWATSSSAAAPPLPTAGHAEVFRWRASTPCAASLA